MRSKRIVTTGTAFPRVPPRNDHCNVSCIVLFDCVCTPEESSCGQTVSSQVIENGVNDMRKISVAPADHCQDGSPTDNEETSKGDLHFNSITHLTENHFIT